MIDSGACEPVLHPDGLWLVSRLNVAMTSKTATRSLPDWLYKGLLLLIASAFVLQNNSADRDLWHRLALGQYFFQHLALPGRDVFSYLSEPVALYDHEWGCGVLFYALHQFVGDWSLVALKWMAFVATLLLLDASGRFYAKERRMLSLAWISLVALALVPSFASTVRCLVFTNFFLALWFYWLAKLRAGYHFPVWPFALTAALWANLHGGFVAGFGLIALYGLGEKLNRRSGMDAVRIGLFAGLATLVNPYTYHLWVSTVKAVIAPRQYIYEWAAPTLWDFSYFGFKLLAASTILTVLALLITGRARKNWDWVAILIVGCTLFLAVRHLRHLALFTILSSVFVYRGWLLLFPFADGDSAGFASRCRGYLDTAILTAVAIVALFLLKTGDQWQLRVSDADYPIRAVEYLAHAPISDARPSKLLVPFNWGSYASWKLFPRYLVSLDGRYELVYSQQTYREVSDFFFDAPGGSAILKSHPPDVILMPRRVQIEKRLVESGRFQVAYQDEQSTVFVRSDSPSAP